MKKKNQKIHQKNHVNNPQTSHRQVFLLTIKVCGLTTETLFECLREDTLLLTF